MPEPVYEWEGIGEIQPWMQIHKTSGNLYWNTAANKFLSGATCLSLQYDEGTNSLGVVPGSDYTVQLDDEGLYHIGAKEALEGCGLVFPLADHISGVPTYQYITGILVIFQLP